VQTGNSYQRKGATYHSYHRAGRKRDIMTIQFLCLNGIVHNLYLEAATHI